MSNVLFDRATGEDYGRTDITLEDWPLHMQHWKLNIGLIDHGANLELADQIIEVLRSRPLLAEPATDLPEIETALLKKQRKRDKGQYVK